MQVRNFHRKSYFYKNYNRFWTIENSSPIIDKLTRINAKKKAKELGFTTIEYYDRDGAQAYRFMNKKDLVIACRGTQPTQWNDIKADLKAIPVMAETIGV